MMESPVAVRVSPASINALRWHKVHGARLVRIINVS